MNVMAEGRKAASGKNRRAAGGMSVESRRFWLLVLVHGAIMLSALFFCEVKYEVSDDFVMELIASGAFSGRPDGHLMFCSYIWGQLLTVLYRLLPGISWYFLAQIAVGFLSLCGFAFFLAHTMDLRGGLLFTVFFAAFFARDIYVLPQFTKTAAVAIASGGLLFVWGLFYRKGKGCVLAGAALTVAGCFLRHNSIFVVGAYIAVYVIFESVRLLRARPCGYARRLRGIYMAGAGLLLAVFALRGINNLAYEMDADYRYYMDYSYVRAYIVDYPLPDYAECAEELQEIGISENDYALICGWTFADREVFSLERMREVLEIVDRHRPVLFSSVRDVLLRFLGRGLKYPGTLCCVLLALLSLCLSRKRFAAAAAAGAVTVTLMLYFICRGHGVYRVEFGYLYAGALLIVYTLPPRETWRDSGRGRLFFRCRYGVWALAAIVSVCQIRDYVPDRSYRALSDEEYRTYIDSIFDFSWDYIREKYSRSVNERDIRPEFLKEVREHPENLYLLDFNTTIQSLYYDFSPFYSFPKGALRNMVYLGGVTVNHPVITETLKPWQAEEGLSALLKDNIYFVSDTNSREVLEFLREHYDPQAEAVLYKELDGYQIWKYKKGAVGSMQGSAG